MLVQEHSARNRQATHPRTVRLTAKALRSALNGGHSQSHQDSSAIHYYVASRRLQWLTSSGQQPERRRHGPSAPDKTLTADLGGPPPPISQKSSSLPPRARPGTARSSSSARLHAQHGCDEHTGRACQRTQAPAWPVTAGATEAAETGHMHCSSGLGRLDTLTSCATPSHSQGASSQGDTLGEQQRRCPQAACEGSSQRQLLFNRRRAPQVEGAPKLGSTVTTSLPAFSGRCATSLAALAAAPDEMPTSRPSSSASRRAYATASSLLTCAAAARAPVGGRAAARPTDAAALPNVDLRLTPATAVSASRRCDNPSDDRARQQLQWTDAGNPGGMQAPRGGADAAARILVGRHACGQD